MKHETYDMTWCHLRCRHTIMCWSHLDGTVISIYYQNISQAVESMQGYPPHLKREAMQKLGKIMQEPSIITDIYCHLSWPFKGLPFANVIFPETNHQYNG